MTDHGMVVPHHDNFGDKGMGLFWGGGKGKFQPLFEVMGLFWGEGKGKFQPLFEVMGLFWGGGKGKFQPLFEVMLHGSLKAIYI